MIYLTYIIIFLSIINVGIGLYYYVMKSLNTKLRESCYKSVLVQLPLMFILIAFGQKAVPTLLIMIAVIIYFLGYMLSVRMTNGIVIRRKY